MNADDRAVVERIEQSTKEINKVLRALSVSLIGKVNGDTVDDGGGRIGRIEKFMWWLFSGLVAIGLWMLANLILKFAR